jgi:CxxC motif-containing protein (DUF1111 family)
MNWRCGGAIGLGGLAAAAALVGALATAAPAPVLPPLEDPHLHIVPRTAAEAARIARVTAPAESFEAAEPFELNPGGAATSTKRVNRDAYSQSSANMPFERELDFKVGNGLFRKLWVSAPASTAASDGLGPLYNARACQHCHLKDGRGHPPEGPGDATSFLLRLSVPAESHPYQAVIPGYIPVAPEPFYGKQLQDHSIQDQTAEGRVRVEYQETTVALSGGESAVLQRPVWSVADPAFGPLAPGTMISPRTAPPMIGLGLVEAIPSADILAHADPEDTDGDGISGRPAIVWSLEYERPMLGRFGWRAGTPTIRQQSAEALSGDMGLSTTLLPEGFGECTTMQADCRAALDGGDPVEVEDDALDRIVFYSRNLAVPARRDVDDGEVLHGKELFYEVGCAACHVPKFVTHRLADRPEQSFQLIWPYSDFLLHDMGPGLADNRPEARATGTEWRTAPLWGIGLTETVSGHTRFLHDGRARGLLEALLWHGGEAQGARDAVVAMPPADRAALLSFLGSL